MSHTHKLKFYVNRLSSTTENEMGASSVKLIQRPKETLLKVSAKRIRSCSLGMGGHSLAINLHVERQNVYFQIHAYKFNLNANGDRFL